MRILMVGSGGREHALIRKLKESPRCEEIYCAPGNGGISKDAVCVDISAEDIDGIAAFAKEKILIWCLWRLTIRWQPAWWMPWSRRESGHLDRGKTPLSLRAARCFLKI